MKRLIYTIFAIAALILSSCSNKVDLYSDEGETTVVYGMLDTNADTNFFKITSICPQKEKVELLPYMKDKNKIIK